MDRILGGSARFVGEGKAECTDQPFGDKMELKQKSALKIKNSGRLRLYGPRTVVQDRTRANPARLDATTDDFF
ncbi:hypothetical protein Pla100_07580 [Neorhodopirellula pilleata]|uniref:Uncharacterized protein n=1 Tax=Neorhodopirellula pilleata TaxID=2714738 RepID=A0A5C6AV34_9BACT|nr:hypothetical protein Pla100_07580 [Neorhodopirellula pilleata]